MSLSMTRAEREEFLAGVHIGILGVDDESGAPLMAPVWYSYQPGGAVRFVTGSDSKKMEGIRRTGRASFLVQTEQAPYVYAWVEGPATLEPADYERDSVGIATRYLGPEGAKQYLASTGGADERSGSVAVVIQPERWRTVDYRKRGR